MWNGSLSLRMEISEEVWHSAVSRTHSVSICITDGSLLLQVSHRLHLNRSTLWRMFPRTDQICCCCHQDENLHWMFWSCPNLVPFSSALFETLCYLQWGNMTSPGTHIIWRSSWSVCSYRCTVWCLSFSVIIGRRARFDTLATRQTSITL